MFSKDVYADYKKVKLIECLTKKESESLESEKRIFFANSSQVGSRTRYFNKNNQVFFGSLSRDAIEMIKDIREKHKDLKYISNRKNVANSLIVWKALNEELNMLACNLTLLEEWETNWS